MRLRAWPVLILIVATIVVLSGASRGQGLTPKRLVRSTYLRLPLAKKTVAVAVADESIVKIIERNDQELLALGKAIGRTSAILWFEDGTSEEILFSVERDLSVLEGALREIHPTLKVEQAPDRDALILRGRVPTIAISRAAESAANGYLSAGATAGKKSELPVVAANDGVPGLGNGANRIRLRDSESTNGSIINLVLVETLPSLLDERIRVALRSIGASKVKVSRIQRGEAPDDQSDVLLLDGKVPNQITLTRVLTLASRIYLGKSAANDDIRVLADEAGSLSGGSTQGNNGASQLGVGGGLNVGGGQGGGGGNIGRSLQNRIQQNIGRATALEVANGRILSFIEVEELPQVRVAIKVYEVNRTRVRNYGSNLGLLTSDFNQTALQPAAAGSVLQGAGASRVGSNGSTDVQNALAFLQGGVSNQFQLAAGEVAVDLLLSVLEAKDLARKLSEPTITVLSGEPAVFQVGGEIPVTQSFAPDGGQGLAQGVFNSVQFVSFGVQLAVRPLAGENGQITLDLVPQVINPDPALTLLVQGTTGGSTATTAFETRSMQTTARLRDGQALVVGGLVNRNQSRERAETPGLSDVPVVEWLFRDFASQDDEIELVIIVTPSIIHEPRAEVTTWEFPSAEELLRRPGRYDSIRKKSVSREPN